MNYKSILGFFSPNKLFSNEVAKTKKPFYKRWWFITIVVVFLLASIGSAFEDKKNTAADSKVGQIATQAKNSGKSKVEEEKDRKAKEEAEQKAKTEQKAKEEAARSHASNTTSNAPRGVAAPKSSGKPAQGGVAAPKSGGNAYYKTCAEVKAAGKAPLYRGEPGYSRRLDRDGDGIACEK